MNAQQVNESLKTGNKVLLLNVLPEEVHAAQRIPGSVNACVYEMVFLDKVAELAPLKDVPIIVYGAGQGSLDSTVAMEKLRAAGYSRVDCFEGGLGGWMDAGFPLEGDGHVPVAPVLHGRYRIDTSASVIRWTGRNLFNQHFGTVRLAEGEIIADQGRLVSSRFVIDMNSIACDDLQDSQWNAMLLNHLRSVDFFLTDQYPVAVFTTDGVESITACNLGSPTHILSGQFTLRDVTRPLQFPVVIASADGKRLTGQGQFEIDRSEFGSIYGSGKFFRFLGKHVVNDLIHLDVMIHADL